MLASMKTDTPKAIYLKDYTPPLYTVTHIDLSFRIFAGKTLVTAVSRLSGDGDAPLFLNGEHLKLISVTLDGITPDYTLNDHGMTIQKPGKKTFTLIIETEITPETNTALEGLYQSGGNYCTQCEAQGFRRITYFIDRPDVLSTYTVRIEADKTPCPVLLSNGNLIEEGAIEGGRHYTLWDDPTPKPCYLFALVAGDLEFVQDRFTTLDGRKVDLRIYVRKGDEGQCAHAMDSLKKSMKWDEDVYGRIYQYERFNIVAVSDFNMGAMENTSLNIFNTALVLAHPDTATDGDFGRVEGVIAHEYFHNWTGNRVTCRDWFQLSLKEGLTVFRDQEFSADMNSPAVQRIDDVTHLRRLQFPEDAGPLSHPVRPDNYIEINNFYTMTVYEKGAEVIRMFHTLLGPETYRKATDLYFDRHDGQAVTCDDWAQCMQDASAMDLSQFKLWYSQAGTPEVRAAGAYNAATKTYTLTLSQTIPDTPGQTNKKPMHIPVAVGLLGANGADLIGTQVLNLTAPHQTFTFENVPSKPVPSILRNFSAPIKLTTDLTDDDLRFLMVHDSDGFNRWESGQTYMLRVIDRVMQTHAVPQDFIAAYGDLLSRALNPHADKALMARALSLPDIPVIAQRQDVVDPQAIHEAREKVLAALKLAHQDALLELYTANTKDGAFSLSPAAMGQRALRNAALGLLTVPCSGECATLAFHHFKAAGNMTDRMAALSRLVEMSAPEREEALTDFYKRYKTHLLVIDKWFGVQAMAQRDDIFDVLKTLRAHPDFTMKNPNRVRSLFGAFAMNNPVCFHRADGAGYTFLKNAVIELNGINPQIAARLLTPLKEWKRYTQDRQEKMRAALEEIKGTDTLSPDVFEIVSKSLNA